MSATGLRVALAMLGLVLVFGTEASARRHGGTRAGPGDDGDPQWVAPEHEVGPPGTTYRTFHSRTIDGPVSYIVYLPPGYEQEGNRCYPVLYWLHGAGGRQEKGARFLHLLDSARQLGKAPPMIVVLVNGLPQSMYVDSVDGRQPVESVIIKDLIPHVSATYRAIPRREGRGVEGFSMGGYGATHLGFKYPEVFGVVSNLAGAVVDWEFFARAAGGGRRDAIHRVFGTREHFDENHPRSLASKNADAIRGNTFVRIVVGEEDRKSYGPNQRLHELLVRLAVPHEFVPVPGVRHSYQRLYEVMGTDRAFEFFRKAFGGVGPTCTGG